MTQAASTRRSSSTKSNTTIRQSTFIAGLKLITWEREGKEMTNNQPGILHRQNLLEANKNFCGRPVNLSGHAQHVTGCDCLGGWLLVYLLLESTFLHYKTSRLQHFHLLFEKATIEFKI